MKPIVVALAVIATSAAPAGAYTFSPRSTTFTGTGMIYLQQILGITSNCGLTISGKGLVLVCCHRS